MKKRGIAAAIVALALAGCGSQAAINSSGSGGPPSQQQTGMDFSALAQKLGVTTAKLQAAMQETRPQASEQPGGSRDDMAADLAKELGLSEAKVTAALEDFMPQGALPSGTPSSSS